MGATRAVALGLGIALAVGGVGVAQAGKKPHHPQEPPVSDIQPGRTVTLLGVGDILVHRQIIDQAYADASGAARIDFTPQLKGIADLVGSVDLAICHMEYPMGPKDGPWTAWPKPPAAPPPLARAIRKTGFDACTTASNHTLDQGFVGVKRLLDALDEHGIAHAGTARTEKEAATPTIVQANGVPVALLSYTYGFDGIPLPAAEPWCANVIDAGRIIKEATLARKLGARIVVVSLHHGYEGVIPPTYEQRSVVNALAASKVVDLVIGQHAHIVQPVEKVQGMWVAYGHGNLLTAQERKDPHTGDGLITTWRFVEQEDGSFVMDQGRGYVVHNDDYPFRLRLVSEKQRGDYALEGSWDRTVRAVMSLDAGKSGFRMMRVKP